ncbi:MAG: 3-isopropylmalate dehydratase small subunit [Myxococcales bacterium]|nr:3-isopropylmalate dehydratase small subunit [Myxococcales bacterium]
MEPFVKLDTRVVPLLADDVDTDQIIPARYLKVTSKVGLGERLFADWRYSSDGSPKPEFVLNDARYHGVRALLAGHNFGCGSSREHAPWALVDWGIRLVLARSFADIFRNNAMKNGLLPVALDAESHSFLLERLTPDLSVHVDLERQVVVLPQGRETRFEIDTFSKKCLLQGLDQLQYLQKFEQLVSAFEQSRLA